ncbi:b64 [miniopterid betaherpesvirus 1]|uniref:B64 n=1 Tax=miniopterid betaherpesvirus 1 TaxID=3070189 RepID=I3VQ53_9BETA|nr:b64 [miniopterid betaherpesvirus 1]AFK83897.1 b64 [miniopterid betaherpesvirus 1]
MAPQNRFPGSTSRTQPRAKKHLGGRRRQQAGENLAQYPEKKGSIQLRKISRTIGGCRSGVPPSGTGEP